MEDNTVTVITKKMRNWWRNFQTPVEVELRLAGHNYRGWAEVETGESDVLEFMIDYLEKRPVDAKAYGLARDEITSEKVAWILPHIVLIHIAITPTDLSLLGPQADAESLGHNVTGGSVDNGCSPHANCH